VLSGLHILVIEANDLVRHTVAEGLRAAGAEVIPVETSRAAFQALADTSVGCVIFDLQLPKVSPVSFVRSLRQLAPGVPLLAMTGLSSGQAEKAAGELGCDGLVSKPVDLEGLRSAAARVVERAKTGQVVSFPPATPGPRVLIVDHDDQVVFTATEALSGLADVEGYRDPEQALDALRARSFDILLADPKMPSTGGLELFVEARKLEPELMPVILTGYPDLETAVLASKEATHEYLLKPIDPALLRVVVRRTWGRIWLERQQGKLVIELMRAQRDLEAKAEVFQTRELELRRAKQADEDILANLPDSLVVVGLDGTIQTVNEQTLKVLEYSREELEGKSMGLILAAGGAADILFTGKPPMVLEKGHVQNFETTYATQRGRHIPMSLNASVIRGDGGEVTGIVVSAKDVTESLRLVDDLSRAQRALDLSHQAFANIVDRAVEGILVVDAQGLICFANPRAEVLLGAERVAVGRPFEVPSAGQATVEVEVLLGSDEPGTAELRTSDTEWHGEPATLIGLWDVTETKRAQQAEQEMTDELRRSNEALDGFARVISHDLRAPLRQIQTYLGFLREDCEKELSHEGKEHIAATLYAVERMRRMINGILEYSRIRSSPVALSEAALGGLIEDACANLASSIEESHASIQVGQMPSLQCRPLQLTQLFQNLIENAIKYRAQRPLRIRIGVDREERAWRCWVRDNGLGMDPELSEKAFELFTRLVTQGDGMGLGLAYCRQIVEGHGGQIWVETALGQGSTFVFTLPLGLRRTTGVSAVRTESARSPASMMTKGNGA
jgi:PAS domain S-box-containing protein